MLSNVVFQDPARARANLARLESRLPETLQALLPTALAQVPDSDTALNNLERLTRPSGAEVLEPIVRRPVLLYHLLALFSHSRFLSESLIQQPELIGWLARDRRLGRIKSQEDLLEEYARFAATQSEVSASVVLARFKRREYLRITLKDILGIAELAETTLELSILADVLIEKALAVAAQELRRRYGDPQAHDASGRLVTARFAVVGLGKLGGNELNYSSDIDLLFLYAGEGETYGPTRTSNREYFIRLAQRLIQLITDVTPEGPVFRVDLRLRPGGGEGDLAISLPAASNYYQRRAREWELQMLLKARHVAGDAALVREFLQGVEPFLYQGDIHFAAVESVLEARERMDRKLTAHGAPLNVKLSPGGIRDIEFLVQCLQRLYGQRDPWVRSGGTLMALQKLHDKGYLAPNDHFRLASAYQFLRRLEHRLQLENGQQTHALPESGEALAVLARRTGLEAFGREAVEMLRKELDEHMHSVRAIYACVIPRSLGEAAGEVFRLEAPPAAGTTRVSELSYPNLVAWFAHRRSPVYEQLQTLTVPERARKSFHRFLAAALTSSERFAALSRVPEALPAAVEVFAQSEALSECLLRQPELLDVLLECARAGETPAREQLALGLAATAGGTAGGSLCEFVSAARSASERMASLRMYFRNQVFRWGAAALWARRPLWESLAGFSALAEEILGVALAMAQKQVRGRRRGRFAVLALGRLATREMDLGSDADVIFLAETPASQPAYGTWRRVAEKLIYIVSSYTRDGTLFPVDARLRPRGSEGELVQNADSVFEYFATTADVWEAVTYLKVRPVAGDLEFASTWCERLRQILAERFAAWDQIGTPLAEMRLRIEEEANRSSREEFNFKTGPGGVYDLDFIISALSLAAGASSLAGCHLQAQVESLPATGRLSEDDRRLLARAALFLRALDHSARLTTGRATSTLPSRPAGLEPVTLLLGRLLGEAVSTGELPLRLEQTCQEVRGIYKNIFA
ncbi:MAG: hypothetical protein ACE5H2_01390 [Terriglobia bacterium]